MFYEHSIEIYKCTYWLKIGAEAGFKSCFGIVQYTLRPCVPVSVLEFRYNVTKLYCLLWKKMSKILVSFDCLKDFRKSTFWPSEIGYFGVKIFKIIPEFPEICQKCWKFWHFQHISENSAMFWFRFWRIFFVKSPYNFRNIFDRQNTGKPKIPGKWKGQKFPANAWP